MLQALRGASGALEDLAEQAAPVLEAEHRTSAVPLGRESERTTEEAEDKETPGEPAHPPGERTKDEKSGVEEPPVTKLGKTKEQVERKKRKRAVDKERKKEKKERREEEVSPNPGGAASSSRGVGLDNDPSYLGLRTLPRGSVSHHFEDSIPGRHRPPEPEEPPRARLEESRHDYSRGGRYPRERSRSKEKKYKGKKHFFRGIERGYTPWKKEQWRRK